MFLAPLPYGQVSVIRGQDSGPESGTHTGYNSKCVLTFGTGL